MTEYIKQKNKKGAALVFALIIVVMVSVILTSLISFIISQVKYSKDRAEREQSFQIAESGIYFYRWYLAHEVSGKTAQQISDFWESGSPYGVSGDYEKEYLDPEGSAIGKYSLHVEKPRVGSTIVTVKSTGWTYKNPNIKRVIEVRFRRPSWSEYMILSNTDVGFGAGRKINGKLHSNGGIRFDGDYVTNVTSSSVAQYDDPDHGGANEYGVHTNWPVSDPYPPAALPLLPAKFRGGRIFPVPQKSFVGVVSDMAFIKTKATVKYERAGEIAAGAEGRHITFKTDGTFKICRVKSAVKDNYNAAGDLVNSVGSKSFTEDNCVSGTSIPNDGVIYIENDVWVDGALDNKRVTLVANNPAAIKNSEKANIYVGKNLGPVGSGNITYAHSDGSEVLGLIAQNNVEIVRDSEENLVLSAAMLAVDGAVFKAYHCGSWKTAITINGAIATNKRYMFSIGGHCGNSGYGQANFNYDNNLLYYPPPYFPTGTEYAIDLWDEL